MKEYQKIKGLVHFLRSSWNWIKDEQTIEMTWKWPSDLQLSGSVLLEGNLWTNARRDGGAHGNNDPPHFSKLRIEKQYKDLLKLIMFHVEERTLTSECSTMQQRWESETDSRDDWSSKMKYNFFKRWCILNIIRFVGLIINVHLKSWTNFINTVCIFCSLQLQMIARIWSNTILSVHLNSFMQTNHRLYIPSGLNLSLFGTYLFRLLPVF